MITLEEILKREEEQTTIPTELKERLLTNIFEQIFTLMKQLDENSTWKLLKKNKNILKN